jgi:hypothetical protein
MILIHVAIGFITLFVAPYLFLAHRFPEVKYSLLLLYSLFFSFTASWVLVLLSYAMDLPHSIIQVLMYSITFWVFYRLYTMHYSKAFIDNLKVWGITLLLLSPFLTQIGIGFTAWDTVASWNNWALELYHNEYKPIDAAYPILFPALWSLLYKIQGNSDIWWSAQITLFVLPLFMIALLLTLYSETKKVVFIFMGVLLYYPFILSPATIDGYMDMPVMLMGTLSLIAFYSAEVYRHEKTYPYYLYVGLLIAGLATITKQSGFAFLLFGIVYILLNLKTIENKRTLFYVMGVSLLFFVSYLLLYYMNNIASPAGNFEHLSALASHNAKKLDSIEYIVWLFEHFFAVPDSMQQFGKLHVDFSSYSIPILVLIGMVLFLFKDLRTYKSMNVLSLLFFIIGTLIWIKYFSYDSRNSYWIKGFYILFVSINLGYLFQRYPLYSLKILVTLLLFGFVYTLYNLGNRYAYTKQEASQKYIGNAKLVSLVESTLKGKKECVKLFTNELNIPFNYKLNIYRKRGQVQLMGRDYKYQDFKFIENNCSEGGWLLFRILAPNHYEWWKVNKLVKDGKIQRVGNEKPLLFYVPPYTKIPRDYFALQTEFVEMELTEHSESIQMNLDGFIENSSMATLFGWAIVANSSFDKTNKYIVLKSDKETYIVKTSEVLREDVATVLQAKGLKRSGFKTTLYKKDFKEGLYDVFILLLDTNGQKYMTSLTKKIEIKQ